MSEPNQPGEIPIQNEFTENPHTAWYWRFSIMEASIYILISMGACFLSASAVWTDESYAKMTTWRWWVLGVSILMAGLSKLQSYLSKTVSDLRTKAKLENDTNFTRRMQ